MTAYDVGIMLGSRVLCRNYRRMSGGLPTVLAGFSRALESLGAGLISSGYKDAIALSSFC